MGKHFRTVGFSLLALTAVMAVSASAAQAKWLILRNGVSVLLLQLNGSFGLSFFLDEELGAKIHCTEGDAEVHALLSADHKNLSAVANILYHGCTDKAFPDCTIHSPGQPNGLKSLSATAVGKMTGEATLFEAKSGGSPFTTIQYLGDLCPLNEFEGEVTGSVTFEILNPLTDSAKHEIDVIGQNLVFSGPAEIHKGNVSELPKGSLTEASSATWAIHLVAL